MLQTVGLFHPSVAVSGIKSGFCDIQTVKQTNCLS